MAKITMRMPSMARMTRFIAFTTLLSATVTYKAQNPSQIIQNWGVKNSDVPTGTASYLHHTRTASYLHHTGTASYLHQPIKGGEIRLVEVIWAVGDHNLVLGSLGDVRVDRTTNIDEHLVDVVDLKQ